MPIIFVIAILSTATPPAVDPFIYSNVYYTEKGCWEAVAHRMPELSPGLRYQCVPYKPLLSD